MLHANTPDGSPMVVLSQDEFAKLTAGRDDLIDAAIADAAHTTDAGAPTMPAELVTAMLAGDMHPMTAWRKAAGLSMAALAEKAGTRAATISDIENGQIDPRYSTVRAIADALGVDVDDVMPA